jgi:HK97 family phage portal protein
MGIFDWLGPTAFGKSRGGGFASLPPIPSQRSVPPGAPLAPVAGPRTITLTDGQSALFMPTTSSVTAADGAGNSAAFACLQAIATAVAEPELAVYEVKKRERIELDDTELGTLLAAPNPWLSLDELLAYAAVCLHVDGNAYWRKLRAGNAIHGNVVELWPIAPSRIEPYTATGSRDYITSYRYTPELTGRVETIPIENVVHFRYGLDDADHRVGAAPLRRLIREISSDAQATRYADRLLANLAINGLTLTFDKEAAPIDQATADQLKQRIQAAYGGDNVGATAVLSPGSQLTSLGFSPEQMDLKTLHRVPEERIAAVLGVPAIVAGLGAGLDRSTYANFKEARETFTEQKLIPLWRYLGATITRALVPDFYPAATVRVLVDFDLDGVRALADDQNAEATRLKTLTDAGILTKDEARAVIGYDPLPEPEPEPVAEEPPTIVELPTALPAALPSGASRRVMRALSSSETKAAEDLPGRYGELYDGSLPTWEAQLLDFLHEQLGRVSRRLRAGADTADALVTEGEAVLLGDTLEPLQQRTLTLVNRLVVAELGIEFQLDDPATRQYLVDCGENIVGITSTTRDAVQSALLEGQAAGEGIEKLARRLRELPAFGPSRATTVARTELGHAQNSAALASYRSSAVVVGIRVHDGDYDAACQAMNGRTFTLDDAPPTLEHPRCVRAFAPLVDAADIARSA